jgi:LmbE family N-acetylglucosaminyl deacetylase
MALCLEEKHAATVYAPWFGDGHRDHRSVACALELALERIPHWTGEAWGFEVWTPLAPERVLDIGTTIERKKLALACHATQSTSGELAHRALGLGAYRSQLLGPGARFAEVFSRFRLARSEDSAA